MTIYDYWLNPLTPVPSQVIGYRGEIDEFPHDLYSYLLSSIREQDQNQVALIWRWLQPMQQFWESQYAQILAIPYLLSPEDCPAPYLDYLRKQVGIMDDMGYVWGALEEADKRRLIKFFVRFLKYRATTFGLGEMVETMTGLPFIYMNYFDYRWILGGSLDTEIETAIGREDDGYDPWLISESDLPVGGLPDEVAVITWQGQDTYIFNVTNFVASLTERPIPSHVYIKYIGTGAGRIVPLHPTFFGYMAMMEPGYLFLQPPSSLSTNVSNFRVSFESDELVSDILIEDDGTLNRDMLVGLVRFSRPQSERVYIRYYNFIEIFRDFERWDEIQGTATWSGTDRNVVLADALVDTIIQCNLDIADDWTTYCVSVKMHHDVNDKYAQIRFMVQGVDDFYYLKLTPATPPHIPAGVWQLRRVVAGTDSLLTSGTLEWLDSGVDYYWRVESITSDRPGGQVQLLRVYQDENMLADYVDNPAPWGGNAKGTVELVVETGGSLTVSRVLVHPLPMESDFVGP